VGAGRGEWDDVGITAEVIVGFALELCGAGIGPRQSRMLEETRQH